MKKILLTIIGGFCFVVAAKAQAPDYGFETWVTVKDTVADPTGWASLNILTNFGMKPSAIKETTAPYAGSAAVKITTQKVVSLVPVGIDTAGFLAIGKINAADIQLGTPFTARPVSFSFATKYQPAGTDTGYVSIELTKWDATTKTTVLVASGEYSTSSPSMGWVKQTVMLQYVNTALVPDTLQFIASSSLDKPQINSALYLDAITWDGSVGTNDVAGVKNTVSIYPVPAKETVTFSSSLDAYAVEITDITGRSLGVFPMTNNKVVVETQRYGQGLYLYSVLNNKKQVMNTGKFQVIN